MLTYDEATIANLIPFLTPDELAEIERLTADTKISTAGVDFTKYQNDPVGFGVEMFGEFYTPDQIRVAESVRDNPITIAESANATGKSQPVDTLVPTPSGWRAIGHLSVGDCVFGVDGRPVEVIGVYPQGDQPTYCVSFNDDTSTLASQDHLWVTISSSQKHKGAKWKIRTTSELSGLLHRYMHIPMCQPVQYREADLKVPPYVMGVLLGDGSLRGSIRFDSDDQEIILRVRELLAGVAEVKYYRKTHYGIVTKRGKGNPVLDACREYGVFGKLAEDKEIPEDYLMGDVSQRIELLRGLMDTDGYIDSRHSMSFSTVSISLAKDIQRLIWSLGGTAKIKGKIPRYTHNGEKRTGQPCYIVNIKIPFCPFHLSRKRARYVPQENLQKQAQRVIKSIDYVGERPSVCIQVANDDGLYLTENYIVTHNTHISARIAIWWYKTHDYAQVYTAAAPPLENLQRLMWGEINALTTRHEHTVFAGNRINFLNISPAAGTDRAFNDPKSFITGVPIPMSGSPAQREAKFSGKHAQNLLFILDEGDAIPYEVYKGIESCLSGGHGRLLVMYNPRSDEGPIADMKKRGVQVVRLSAFDHPNVISGTDRYPGAVTRNKTLHRINKWSRPADSPGAENMTTYGRFTVPDFLVGVPFTDEETGAPQETIPAGERIIIEPEFSYMVLGLYPGQSEGVIYDTWLDDYDEAKSHGRSPVGNVTAQADYLPGTGTIYWALDDGYVGKLDPQTGEFTADSHPRVILAFQERNGMLCLFDEYYVIRQPRPEVQVREMAQRGAPFDPGRVTAGNLEETFPVGGVIRLNHPTIGPGLLKRVSQGVMSLEHGGNVQEAPADQFPSFCQRAVAEGIEMYTAVPRPEFVALGPGSATVSGLLHDLDYFTRTCTDSVEETIKLMRHMISPDENGVRRLLVHPRCAHFRYEIARYRKDSYQRIIKAYDHGCLIGETKVLTSLGEKEICRISEGDMVMTRSGYKTVVWSGMTHYSAAVLTVHLSDGRKLTGTADHPVYTETGFVPIGNLKKGDKIQSITSGINKRSGLCHQKKSHIRESFSGVIRSQRIGQIETITGRMVSTLKVAFRRSIGKYGWIIMEKFQMGTISTTRTMIQQTTASKILSALIARNIKPGTGIKQRASNIYSTERNSLREFGRLLLNGTEAKRGESGTGNTRGELQRSAKNYLLKKCVGTVGSGLWLTVTLPMRFIARIIASRQQGVPLGLITKRDSASFAAKHSWLTNTKKQNAAHVYVLRVTAEEKKAPVYNLKVEGVPEFYANGILVHNCDAARYLCVALRYELGLVEEG